VSSTSAFSSRFEPDSRPPDRDIPAHQALQSVYLNPDFRPNPKFSSSLGSITVSFSFQKTPQVKKQQNAGNDEGNNTWQKTVDEWSQTGSHHLIVQSPVILGWSSDQEPLARGRSTRKEQSQQQNRNRDINLGSQSHFTLTPLSALTR
jgi:hypothetical protein